LKTLIDVTNINEKVFDFIKQRIINLTYPPGSKLTVRRLTKELGVSQTPIKDALFRLAGERMVEITSRQGCYVRGISRQDISEIFETRIILEKGAAETLSRQITPDQFKKLEHLYKETLNDRAQKDYRLFLEKESEFHLAIIRLTNNSWLLNIYKQLSHHMQILRLLRFMNNFSLLKRRPSTNKEHRDILLAIKKKDPEGALKSVERHLNKAKRSFLDKTETYLKIAATQKREEVIGKSKLEA
jgi:DNA-binding GntR family transcriptional regulator